MKNSHNFEKKKILELGSGVGLTGIAVIKTCQPNSYIFTDHHPLVLKTLATNININIDNEQSTTTNIDVLESDEQFKVR